MNVEVGEYYLYKSTELNVEVLLKATEKHNEEDFSFSIVSISGIKEERLKPLNNLINYSVILPINRKNLKHIKKEEVKYYLL